MSTASGPELLAAALGELDQRLDWPALGCLYCSEGGEDFFDEESREAIFDTALRLVGDVAGTLEDAGGTTGRSLYVGAGVAELPLILAESLVLGRRVVCAGPPTQERAALDAALAETEQELGVRLPRYGREPVPERPRASIGTFDHLWLVSVLNDPEAFPALHDRLYGRAGGELATGRGDLVKERRAAERLVVRLAEALELPAVLTTTDEELPVLLAALEGTGQELHVPERARLSGIVGDPVRCCRLLPGAG